MRRIAIASLVLFAVLASACGGDDDSTVASKPTDKTTTTASADDGGPTAADGDAALEFFQSTEAACKAHAEETSNPVLDPSLFADASYDAPMSKELGAIVIIDGAGNQLIVNADRGVVTSTDGESGALPSEYSFACPPDIYLGTMDDGGQAAGDPCPEWEGWLSDGDNAHLEAMKTILNDDPASGDTLEAIDYLLSDPATESADDQSNYEANVDTITADMSDRFGCKGPGE